MKYINYFTALLFVFSLISCENKDEPEVPEEYPYYFGYFDGKVNNQQISLKNERYKSYLWSSYSIFNDIERYEFMVSLDGDDRKTVLRVYLAPLAEGPHEITSGWYAEDFAHYTSIIKSDNEGKTTAKYYPSPDNPVVVEVESIVFKSSSVIPFIKGKIEGTLYNTENPDDFIVIKDVEFGCH